MEPLEPRYKSNPTVTSKRQPLSMLHRPGTTPVGGTHFTGGLLAITVGVNSCSWPLQLTPPLPTSRGVQYTISIGLVRCGALAWLLLKLRYECCYTEHIAMRNNTRRFPPGWAEAQQKYRTAECSWTSIGAGESYELYICAHPNVQGMDDDQLRSEDSSVGGREMISNSWLGSGEK